MTVDIISSLFLSNMAENLSNGVQCASGVQTQKCQTVGANANAGSTSGGGAVYLSLANVGNVQVRAFCVSPLYFLWL